MTNILCFGDSNVHGSCPTGGRFDWNTRWPGRLQKALGDEFHIIEEGLGGRNTVSDDPLEPGRNGLKALPMILHSHQPLDMVIVLLGSNDCKFIFNASPAVIADGLRKVCQQIKRYPYREGYKIPEILLLSPPHIGEKIEGGIFASYDNSSYEKSMKLAPFVKKVAEVEKTLFLDTAESYRQVQEEYKGITV